jgi:hypothetical protein
MEYPGRPGATVEHEVHRPDFMGCVRPDKWLPLGYPDLLVPPPSHLELLQSIYPLDALVVDQLASLAQQLQIDHLDAIPSMLLR